MMGFKKRGVVFFTAASMVLSALTPGFALANEDVLELAAEKNVLNEDYTANALNQGELEALGWTENGIYSQADSGTLHAPENGIFSAESGKLTMTKTSKASSTNGGKTIYTVEKPFNFVQENYNGNERVTLRQSNLKGKYAVELKGFEPNSSGQSTWIDVYGWRNNGNQTSGVGRLRMHQNKNFYVYNNKINSSSGDGGFLWDNANTKSDVKLIFDSASSTFQVYKNGELQKVTANLVSGASADTFPMTNWGNASAPNGGVGAGAYICGLAFSAPNQMAADFEYILMDGLTVTELDRMEDPADLQAEKITMNSITQTPEAVTENLVLPTAAEPDVTVTWTSENPEIITNDGVVHRPLSGESDAQVTLTAKIVNTANMFTLYKDFALTVSAEEGAPDERLEILNRAKAALTVDLLTDTPNAVVGDLKKPLISSWTDKGESGKEVLISWKSDNTAVILDDGTLVGQDNQNHKVMMTATLSVEDQSDTKSFHLTVPALPEQGVIINETFADKTIQNNTLPNWEYMESAVGTGTNVINAKGNLVLTKNEKPATTHGEYPQNKYTLTQVKEAYNENSRTEVLKQAFRGKYKLELKIIPHIKQQFIPVRFWGGTHGAEKPAFGLCVRNTLIDIYISSGNYFTVANNINIDGKETTISFEIDTDTNKVLISVNDAAPVTFDATGMAGGSSYFLQAVSVGLKESSALGDNVEIVSVKLYERENYIKNEAEIQAAMKKVKATDLTANPADVRENLTLPAEQDGISITWESGDSSLIRKDGTLVERPFDSDKNVAMTASFQKDGTVWNKVFYLTVKKVSDPQEILKAAADALDYDDLISGDKDELNENIKVTEKGMYGTTITWKSSEPEYINDAGVILKHDSMIKKEVSMTATFHYGGQTLEKVFTFHLTVPFSGDYTFFKTDFTGEKLPEYVEPFGLEGNGNLEIKDGKLYIHRTNEGTSTDGPGVKIYPTLDGKRFTIGEECVIYTDVVEPKDCKKIEMVFYGSNGNRITSLYSGVDSKKGKGFTVVARTALDEAAVHKRVDLGTDEMRLHIECRVNFATKAMTLKVNDVTYDELKFTREDASDFAYMEIKTIYDTNNKNAHTGTAILEGTGVRVTKAMVPSIIAGQVDYFGAVENLNGYITKDVPLFNTAYGDTVVSWNSSNPEIFTNDGKLNRNAFAKDTPLILTFKLAMKNTPEIYLERKFDLIALYMDPGNLAYDKKAESSGYSLTGHGAGMAVDGNFGTSWQTLRADETPALTVDLGKNEVINQVDLSEAPVLDRYTVKKFVIEVSGDNKKWTQISSGTALGEQTKSLNFEPTLARYVRYRVTEKEEGNTGLNEIQVF